MRDVRLRRLFEAGVIGIVISNNAGHFLEVNDAFLAMIGYARADFDAGLIDWRKLTPPEWLELDERAIAEMAVNKVFAPYEKEYFRKDGTRLPISLGGARIEGTDDEQICYIVDLSAKRDSEQALRRSELRFRRLTDANVIGIIRSRLSNDTISEANDEFLRTIGYTREELRRGAIGWTALTPPEWREATQRSRADLRTHGRFAPYEKEFLRKDGSRVPVLVGGALLDADEDEVVSYVLDLTTQRESLLRYRILADALPQIVMISDDDRRPMYVNRHYEEYTGIGSAALPEHWAEQIHPDDLPAIARARATGESYEVEYRLRRAADGAFRWHYARVMKLPGESRSARWLAAAIDIDDRKRAEDALRFIEKASARLSQSLDLQTTFATLLELVVPEFGDWATINLSDERGIITTVVARHRDPAKAHLVRAISGLERRADDQRWSATLGVYRGGTPQMLAQPDLDKMLATVPEPYASIFAELGFGSLISLPIIDGDAVIGTFNIVAADADRARTSADLPALEELARRAGFAIANARRFEREHRVATLLQEATLPSDLPNVDGIRFDGYYQAGKQEAQIGGDWYDALIVGDGTVVLSVGDVAGSGLAAAVLMGKVRQIIRAAAHVTVEPLAILDIAERTLRSEHGSLMVTAFVGVLDPASRTLRYASAGHVPALLRAADGRLCELHARGLPLGLRDLATTADMHESRAATIPPGASLLLYTDGLVEWSRGLELGDVRLHERFAAGGYLALPHPAKALVDDVLPTAGARDDVAALLVCFEG